MPNKIDIFDWKENFWSYLTDSVSLTDDWSTSLGDCFFGLGWASSPYLQLNSMNFLVKVIDMNQHSKVVYFSNERFV